MNYAAQVFFSMKEGNMTIASRRLKLHVGLALLGICLIFCSGCSSLASLKFTRTTMDESARNYPTFQSHCRCTETFTATKGNAQPG
jgi:hypothetical protein